MGDNAKDTIDFAVAHTVAELLQILGGDSKGAEVVAEECIAFVAAARGDALASVPEMLGLMIGKLAERSIQGKRIRDRR